MTARDIPLTSEQVERYSRQIILKEVGIEGQEKLLKARVLIVGAGGLGSPAAIYLAAAGVGTVGMVDGDRVDRSNLQRQILHGQDDIGRLKTESARLRLQQVNPEVNVREHCVVLNSRNAMSILQDYDLVVNGSDNFPTRYLVNDACFFLRKPLVDASILRFEGQLTVFMPGHGCYRCLFPSPPPPGSVPNCAEAGIIGALAGHMGTLQAIEAVKIILGVGEPATSRLILFDALHTEYRTLHWRANEDCPLCGRNPSLDQLEDYEQFCGTALPAGQIDDLPVPEIDVQQAEAWSHDEQVQWIDVRQSWEYGQAHIPGARLLPLHLLDKRSREIDRDRPAVLVCATGVRSAAAAKMLLQEGFQKVYNLSGGMLAWQSARLPVERKPDSQKDT